MLVKVECALNWHSHGDTDDFFLVLDGELDIELREGTVHLKSGEMFVVPKGLEHQPVTASGTAELLLIERTGTPKYWRSGDCCKARSGLTPPICPRAAQGPDRGRYI